MNFKDYKNKFQNVEDLLVSTFGRKRLEETAFPVYYNKFPPASYLGWSRVETAQKLLSGIHGRTALDFGAGLGAMLPYLASHYDKVVALDLDPEITRLMKKELNLTSVEVVKNINESKIKSNFDVIVALDVLEHVIDLPEVYELFNSVTPNKGVWIISGPTENFLYKFARRITNTSGEGHVRNIYDVFNEIPKDMICEKIYRLPWGIPLFLIGRFKKIA